MGKLQGVGGVIAYIEISKRVGLNFYKHYQLNNSPCRRSQIHTPAMAGTAKGSKMSVDSLRHSEVLVA